MFAYRAGWKYIHVEFNSASWLRTLNVIKYPQIPFLNFDYLSYHWTGNIKGKYMNKWNQI